MKIHERFLVLSTVALTGICAASPLAQADSSRLLNILSDARPGITYEIDVMTDENSDLTGIRYIPSDAVVETYSLEQLKAGVVLVRDSERNKDIITIQTKSGDGHSGGIVAVTFLVNGFTGSTGTFSLQVLRNGTTWVPYTAQESGQRSFSLLCMYKNTFLGKTIGISRAEATNATGCDF